jgi:hypothetical protein
MTSLAVSCCLTLRHPVQVNQLQQESVRIRIKIKEVLPEKCIAIPMPPPKETVAERADAANKTWNFPKFHALGHVCAGLMLYGTRRLSSTESMESYHCVLKRVRMEQTNKHANWEEQVVIAHNRTAHNCLLLFYLFAR